MEDIEKAEILRRMSKGAEDLDEDVIRRYLEAARESILNFLYPFGIPANVELPSRYDFVQIRIAIYNIHKRGAEGETKHIEVGTERDYASGDIPTDLLKEITPMCGFPE